MSQPQAEIFGSIEWLQSHAFFVCDYCAAGSEPTCHRADSLRLWNGQTICDECWNNITDDSLPKSWNDMETFKPFRFEKTP